MAVRSSNALWEVEMARFVNNIAKVVTPYLAKNGGPIVLAQIENEYSWDDPAYIKWSGDLANGLGLGIPWLMCNGESANNTINAANGNDAAGYAETHNVTHPGQPLVWTEDEGWFQEWDKTPNVATYDNRSPQDMALVVLKWFARGGCYHNYYMWYGGNNYAQWAGSSVANQYADGVNLHHDALPNEPKKTHLQTLHHLLAKYSSVLLGTPSQVHHKYIVQVFDDKTHKYVYATHQWAYVYKNSHGAVMFLENEVNYTVMIKVGIHNFNLKKYSISVVDYNSMKELYNSADVSYAGLATKRVFTPLKTKLAWRMWQENVTILQGAFSAGQPLEQLNLTLTDTDYLFYQTSIRVSSAVNNIAVKINSTDSNAFLAFIDGKFQSHTFNNQHKYNSFKVEYSLPVNITDTDSHKLTLLSVNLGTDNGVSPGSFDSKGIVSGVSLGFDNITNGEWLHRPKLEGEIKQIFKAEGSASVVWDQDGAKYVNKPVVWFQTAFTRIEVQSGHSILLDLAGMGRGHIFLNGFPLGRYWSIQVGGAYVQRYYFIPPGLIGETNLLTLAEELGAADVESVSIQDSTFVVP